MEIRTIRCSLHGHPEIAIRFDQLLALDIDAKWLVAFLESSVAEGRKYEPGQTLQIGWTVTKFQQSDANLVRLLEPVPGSEPIVFADSVTHTLAHLRQQKDVAESFCPPIEWDFPSMLQSALVCTDLSIPEAGVGVMARHAPDGRDSGWFFGCENSHHDHNDPANLVRLSLYRVGCQNPSVIKYLALPAGTLIQELASTKPCFLFQGAERQIAGGSYLDHLRSGL
jgi:hypothetical protein